MGQAQPYLQIEELLKNLQQNLRHSQDFHISTWYVYRPRAFTQASQTQETKVCEEIVSLSRNIYNSSNAHHLHCT